MAEERVRDTEKEDRVMAKRIENDSGNEGQKARDHILLYMYQHLLHGIFCMHEKDLEIFLALSVFFFW